MFKRPFTTLIILLILTISAALASSFSEKLNIPIILFVMLLSVSKVLIVVFSFMELRHAHAFWKFAIVITSFGIMAGILLLY